MPRASSALNTRDVESAGPTATRVTDFELASPSTSGVRIGCGASTQDRTARLPLASVSQGVVTAATGAALTLVLRRALVTSGSMSAVEAVKDNAAAAAVISSSSAVTTTAPPPPTGPTPPKPDQKPAHDVVAGAMARAASQGTIHPLDTMKVRMQTSGSGGPAVATGQQRPRGLARGLHEFGDLYKGVFGAATGAGLIIGTYFAFYSTTKKYLRKHTALPDGTVAFASGATAALGSSVVKVPLAVCIRSVQAGVYTNAFVAAREIVRAAGPRGLFTGFLPTILEDVPDMAVKFAVYETVRNLHSRLRGRHATTLEDLVIGGVAGAAAAAATTPLDVVKTVMMTSASARPTVLSASRTILREGGGLKAFFRGVGPRALSNGLNSAVFFCFFEAIRQVLVKRQAQRAALLLEKKQTETTTRMGNFSWQQKGNARRAAAAAPAACLSLALPVQHYSSPLLCSSSDLATR